MSKHNSNSFTSVRSSRFNLAGRSINLAYIIAGLVLCACIIGSIWWFRHNFEQVTSTDYALKTQAQYNPYYAAELLLNSQYPSIKELDSSENNEWTDEFATTLLDSDLKTLIDGLPNIDKTEIANGKRPTLIINSIGTKLTDARFDALKSWIEQGGHLVTFTSKGSDDDDMQAALERLETLQSETASIETITNDETLNDLMAALDSGNEFLNQLGVFRVNSDGNFDKYNKPEGDLNTQLEELLDEVQERQAIEENKSSKAFVEEKLAELLDFQPLSLINLTPRNEQNATDDINQNILLVKVAGLGSHLNAQLFQTFYPNSAYLHSQYPNDDNKTIKQQAQLIRHYINASTLASQNNTANDKQDLNTNVNDSIINSTIKNPKSNNYKTQSSKYQEFKSNDLKNIPELLAAILVLNDAQLVALFDPIDNVYLDAAFGNGRISVINNNDVFSNPNPNIDLFDAYTSNGVEGTDSVSISPPISVPTSMLYDLITPSSYYTSLLSADNAAWLISLTRDSTEVWILPNTDIDPLPVMLWKQARPAVLGLGLLAFVWLWSLYNRFGKMARLPTSQTRDILRYFRQIGRFGWHQDRAHKLTKATRDRVRLLVNEHLQNSFANDSQASAVDNTQIQVKQIQLNKLHELLIARLADKKELLKRPVAHPISGIDHHVDDVSDNSSDSLLLTNEAFIREAIDPDRLRSAFDYGLQGNNSAFDFTQMTQTLWMIQWLLK